MYFERLERRIATGVAPHFWKNMWIFHEHVGPGGIDVLLYPFRGPAGDTLDRLCILAQSVL